MTTVDHIQGFTFHGRKGSVENAFRYSIDYILCDPEDMDHSPRLFSKNALNVMGLLDADHGGPPRQGRGVAWVREILKQNDLPGQEKIQLLAQPRFWGHVFNPVSFWLCYDSQMNLRVVIAEVTNTFGERHSYLCHRDDLGPIGPSDQIAATKIFYVSPFQKIEGGYLFRFDIREDRIGVWIDYSNGNNGLIATLVGQRKTLTNRSILWSTLRRPLGSRRVQFLIHWQALKLWWKGAKYRVRPAPPVDEISR